jgi:hypothetical protein
MGNQMIGGGGLPSNRPDKKYRPGMRKVAPPLQKKYRPRIPGKKIRPAVRAAVWYGARRGSADGTYTRRLMGVPTQPLPMKERAALSGRPDLP